MRLSSLSLFDSDGLPWTTRLDLGWLILLQLISGGLVVVPMGIYLGLWLFKRGHSAAVLILFILQACLTLFLALPLAFSSARLLDILSLSALLICLAGPFLARHQIQRDYQAHEAARFPLSILWTFLFSATYLTYRLRPFYPASN